MASDIITTDKPSFVIDMENDYSAKVAHVFILHGNIDDYSDNSGNHKLIEGTLSTQYDSFMRIAAPGGDTQNNDEDERTGFTVAGSSQSTGPRIMAKFTFGQGLEFFHTESRKTFLDFLKAYYPEDVRTSSWREDWENPANLECLIFVLNRWFEASKNVVWTNRGKKARKQATTPEIRFTIMFPDADVMFPAGTISAMGADRIPIVNLRQWGRDIKIGDRNRILLLTKSITDIHSSLTAGAVGITSHLVKKPTIEDRETWITNFANNVVRRTANNPGKVGPNQVTKVNLSEGFTFRDFAIQSAGMSRRQIDEVIMHSWLSSEPVDFAMVRSRKQRALAEEYSSIIDFFEPEYGFELVGGHENLKSYFTHNVIDPLRKGDKKLCSKGVLMVGPPGTAKTFMAKALAKEAKMNFMIAKLDKVFGNLVGDSEKNTRRLLDAIEAACPVIVFLDELDSILSSGRQSAGDSGTSARVFNGIMTWLSDESRAGRVVVVSASNRPDLLDAALIRSGRFDAILPALPPQKGDRVGRGKILEALCHKFDVKFAKNVAATETSTTEGIGLILQDKERVWTGAEMEVVLKKALQISSRKGEKNMTTETWTQAYRFVIPNTQEVERMTLLALLYTNDLEYCPEEFREEANDKKGLRERLRVLGWEEE